MNLFCFCLEAGTSPNMCSNTYAGASAFSEKCTQNMRDRLNELKSDIKLYMAVHSYSQMWLTPWGYALDFPSDYAQLVGEYQDIVEVNFTRWSLTVNNWLQILYIGCVIDWAALVANIL